MNLAHLVALIKLRFQLSANQVKKAGRLNVILSIISMVFVAAVTVSSFFVGVFGGAIWFQTTTSTTILTTWSVIVMVFLAMWLIGLLVELQQTELMSIDKLLHLPVSLRGAFFLNYTSSFVNANFLMSVPLMLGLSFGLALARGPELLLSLPLVVTFLFAVTTLTYQIRGWLARIMENKRKRGTVIAVITIGVIVLSQVPYLVTNSIQGSNEERAERTRARTVHARKLAQHEVDIKLSVGELSENQIGLGLDQMHASIPARLKIQRQHDREDRISRFFAAVEQASVYFPPWWLPLGVVRSDQGNPFPAILGSLGFLMIGVLSLSMSYRVSMRKYMGVDSPRKSRDVKPSRQTNADLLFKKLPLVSDQVSTVALSGYRGLMRAPETKMALIFPVIMGIIGSSFLIGKSDWSIPEMVRPFVPVAIITMTMFGLTNILFNQFGMDRDGFRSYMLSPVRRRDVLLGKNLAVAPLAFGISLALIALTQFLVPQGAFELMGSLLQLPAIFLLYCILGNLISILFPMGIKRGTMQPANPRLVPMLIMFLGAVIGPMLLTLPTLVACGIPIIAASITELSMGWLYCLLSAVQLGVTWMLYKLSLVQLDKLLWARETSILDVVANIPE